MTMKLNSRKALGKQAPCPKCGKPFLVRELAPPEDDFAGADDVDDYDTGDSYGEDDFDYHDESFDDYESAGRPVRSKKRGKKKRKKKKSVNWVKPTLLIAGSVVGLLVLGVGLWLLWGLFSKKLEMAWLPPDATSISVERPASNWNSSPIGDRYTSEQTDKLLEKTKEYWGVTPRDIKSITKGSNKTGVSITVVRSGSTLDPEKILGNGGDFKKVEHDGESYYLIGRRAYYFPDGKTLVRGNEDAVKAAISRGPDPPEREDLSFVDAGYDEVNVQTNPGGFGGRFSPAGGIFQGDESEKPAEPEIVASGTTAGSSTGKGKIQFKYASESVAEAEYERMQKQHERSLEKWESSGRKSLEQLLRRPKRFLGAEYSYTDEEVENALDCRERELKSISISQSGRVVSVKLTHYVTEYSKRRAREIRAKRTFDADRIAKAWGRSTFGVSSLTRFGR